MENPGGQWQNPSDAEIREILTNTRVIAVVGISRNPEKPSHHVAKYLQEAGYRIVPVNPTIDSVLGETAYPSLTAIPFVVDLVDIFRPAADVPPVVDEAIRIKAKAVWLQEGIVNPAAGTTAAAAGLQVVMDLCLLKEHSRLVK